VTAAVGHRAAEFRGWIGRAGERPAASRASGVAHRRRHADGADTLEARRARWTADRHAARVHADDAAGSGARLRPARLGGRIVGVRHANRTADARRPAREHLARARVRPASAEDPRRAGCRGCAGVHTGAVDLRGAGVAVVAGCRVGWRLRVHGDGRVHRIAVDGRVFDGAVDRGGVVRRGVLRYNGVIHRRRVLDRDVLLRSAGRTIRPRRVRIRLGGRDRSVRRRHRSVCRLFGAVRPAALQSVVARWRAAARNDGHKGREGHHHCDGKTRNPPMNHNRSRYGYGSPSAIGCRPRHANIRPIYLRIFAYAYPTNANTRTIDHFRRRVRGERCPARWPAFHAKFSFTRNRRRDRSGPAIVDVRTPLSRAR
jgi:hypothetical protein